MTSSPSSVTVVILTFNRCAEVLQTLSRVGQAMPDIPLVLVDNGSTDATADQVALNFPHVTVVRVGRNLGAAGRNVGVRAVHTAFVAFCDDDTCWEPGAVLRAVELLDQNHDIAVVAARVLVGQQGYPDPACEPMQTSPLGDLPQGRRILGFMAGACVMRVSCFTTVGGYWPPFFIGGEEALMALDFADRGWHMIYASNVVTRHYPSPLRDMAGRRYFLARNSIWTAWMRLPIAMAVRHTATVLMLSETKMARLRLLAATGMGLPRTLWHRKVVNRQVQQMRALLDRQSTDCPR